MRFKYATNCVNSTGKSVNDMKDHHLERSITRRTFLQKVEKEDLKQLEADLGYESHPRQGLTAAGDWHISYHKSFYKGEPCVYMVHSAIEYIFTETGRG